MNKPVIVAELNPQTLRIDLKFKDVDQRNINLIFLSISSTSENYIISDDGIELPLSEFRQCLPDLSYRIIKEGIAIIFDPLAQNLLNEIIDDTRMSKISSREDNLTFEIEPSLKSQGFNRNLTDEQIRDLKSLLRMKHGANFSVPGAGKTSTILALHTILKQQSVVNLLIVVSPINAFISWDSEIQEIFSGDRELYRLSIKEIREGLKIKPNDNRILITNYEKLRGDINGLIPIFLQNKVHLVLDESHRIKSGENNQSFNQIVKIADISKRRDIMTGTPMPHSWTDLSPQFNFLWRVDLIPEIDTRENIDEIKKRLNNSISNKYVRTTKNELGLKDPKIIYSKVELGPIQSELYSLFRSEIKRTLSGMDQTNKEYFRSIGRNVMRLIEAATNPMLLGAESDYDDEVLEFPPESNVWEILRDFAKYEKPGKIEYLRSRVEEILDNHKDNKVVIWSYFVRNILLLERLLKQYNPVTIFGGVPVGSDEDESYREARIIKFHKDPSCRILIANPQACGEAISLHKASHYAIYLDRNFNAAYYLQSVDRIHRLGLPKSIDTTIEIIVAENTIDEVLVERLNQKVEAMGKVFDDPYLLKMAYDPLDISDDEIFGLDQNDVNIIKKHLNGDD